jgi:hypothetical protein
VLRSVLYLLFAAYFVAIGILATVWPEKVRAFFIRQYMSVLGGLKELIGPDTLEKLFPRVFLFRLFGITSLLASALVVYLWLR